MSKLLNLVNYVETATFILEVGWPDIFVEMDIHGIDEHAADEHEKTLKKLRSRVKQLKEYATTLAKPTPEQSIDLLKKVHAMVLSTHLKAIEELAHKKKITHVEMLGKFTRCWRGNKETKCKVINALAEKVEHWCQDVPVRWSDKEGWQD